MRRSPLTAIVVSTAALLGVGLVACDTDDGRTIRPPTPSQISALPTTTSSTIAGVPLDTGTFAPPVTVLADPSSTVPSSTTNTTGTIASASVPAPFAVIGPWATGGAIPTEYTCEGAEDMPVIEWTAPPAGTVEVAIVVTDRDAEQFVHYAAAGLPPTAGGVGGAEVPGMVEATNGFGQPGWSGPCPPAGTTHTYVWTVYALATPSGFTAETPVGTWIETLIGTNAFASADYTGVFTRPG
ncbi:MAG: YbhB/YbcL family Raf kinase inhibitor-like protein [Desertimonas sp.]